MILLKKQAQIDEEENYKILMNYCDKWASQNVRCIAVSSYIDQQGKTKLIMKLGERLAKAGYKTLLVDCNMITPTLSKKYNYQRSEGILQGIEKINESHGKIPKGELLQFAQATQVENLYIYARGGYLEKEYTEYVNERSVEYLFKILKETFMYVLIEAPSFRYLSFAQVFLGAADGYLLAVKADTILLKEIGQLKRKTDTIESKALGAIFTHIKDM